MAELGGGKTPRIDMTPMVDLVFLLITFFMLATSLNVPSVMPVVVPKDAKDKKKVDEGEVKMSKTETLVMAEKHKIFYYQLLGEGGQERPEVTDFKGVRKLLQKRVKEVKQQHNDDLIVLLKFHKGSTYKDMVDILDEINIVGVKKYAIVEITDTDNEWVEKLIKDGF